MIIILLILNAIAQPLVSWDTQVQDLGPLQQDEVATAIFTLTNTSASPLLIDNVRTNCGCTVADWRSDAIPPSDTAQIVVEYVARKKGFFKQNIKVFISGQRRAERLVLHGEAL
jgi:hypothetical protein